ncbi:MAG: GntR family transcriptional regulator [Clostridia bacterium]|nr:GntR family transcriptional regulator [Clostridia bacterium]
MKSIYKVNAELDIPIYQQLVDAICVAIKNGSLVSGQQLPTVQGMVDEVGVARGTVKRAYDELERIGLVEKVQGSGTFVKYQPANSGSRKEKAMAAIDEMLDKLEGMGLSPSEINIFLNLKLRERSQEEARVKVAVIECNPENLSQMSKQLRHIDELDLYSYTIDSIKQYPYKLSEEYDLIVTTSLHSEYLESVVPFKKRIARVALRPSAHCLSHIIKLGAGKKIGVVGYSQRFAELMYSACEMYAEEVVLNRPVIAGEGVDVAKYLKDKDAILIPKNYEKYFDEKTVKAIVQFKGEVIDCNYEMDEGSVLYLESKIKKIRDEKTI